MHGVYIAVKPHDTVAEIVHNALEACTERVPRNRPWKFAIGRENKDSDEYRVQMYDVADELTIDMLADAEYNFDLDFQIIQRGFSTGLGLLS